MLFLDFSEILSVAAFRDSAAGHRNRRDRRSELRAEWRGRNDDRED
jgi:hypothetical protein